MKNGMKMMSKRKPLTKWKKAEKRAWRNTGNRLQAIIKKFKAGIYDEDIRALREDFRRLYENYMGDVAKVGDLEDDPGAER